MGTSARRLGGGVAPLAGDGIEVFSFFFSQTFYIIIEILFNIKIIVNISTI